MSQHTVNYSNTCSNNANSFNVWNNCTFTDDRSQLLAWLSPLEPSLRHRDVRERRINNVGNGSCKPRNSEDGAAGVGKVGAEVIAPLYFATGIRGSVKHLSGNKEYSSKREEVSTCANKPRYQFASSRQAM